MKDSPGIAAPADAPGANPPPANWREAIPALVAARLAIFRIESRAAAASAARRLLFAAAAAFLAITAWLLLVAGGVSAIAAATGAAWHWIALAAAGFHLIVAWILLAAAKKSGPPPFPATLAEFQKDREWLEKCRNNRTSNN